MASSESSEITSGVEPPQESYSKPRNPFLSLIPKFPFGFFNRGGGGGGGRVDVVIKKESTAGEGEDSRSSEKPDVVTFPLREPQTEPLKIESEEAEKSSNPIFLWQVYALGGFILVKWAWSKWQERQANAKKKKDDDSAAEDQSPNNDGE